MRKKKITTQSANNIYILPSEFNSMDTHINTNKAKLLEYVLTAIDNAIDTKQATIELFNFQGSEYIITLSIDSFQSNIDNIYKFYVGTEQYELCARVKRIREKLTQYEKK
jgi:hypothetical protein